MPSECQISVMPSCMESARLLILIVRPAWYPRVKNVKEKVSNEERNLKLIF